MKWFKRLGLATLIIANSKILIRLVITCFIIFLMNLIYGKYEAILLITNPNKLFIPLSIYSIISIILVLWMLFSFRSFHSISKSREIIRAKQSFENKPEEYNKISDVKKYPKLKSFSNAKE